MSTIERHETRHGSTAKARTDRTSRALQELCGVLILLGVIWFGLRTGFPATWKPLGLWLVVLGAVLARPRR